MTTDPASLDAALTQLELGVRRRLDGLLHGNHIGLVPGPGSEPGDARPYDPGDDVRRIDWSVTARTTVPHIRQTVADRELETWFAIDLSASLDFGTADCEKRDLVVAAASAFTHLTGGGGNRIGAVIAHSNDVTRIPARTGQHAAWHLLRQIAATPRSKVGARADISTALEQLRRPPRRRGLIVILSDFLGPLTWERPLRALAARHDVIAVDISDPRDQALPSVGVVTLVDPETGRLKKIETTARLRADFAAAAEQHRADVAAVFRRLGLAQLSLSTDRDWLADCVRFAVARKRGWSGAQSARREILSTQSVGARPGAGQ